MTDFIGKSPGEMTDVELREAQKVAIEDVKQSLFRNREIFAIGAGESSWNLTVIKECHRRWPPRSLRRTFALLRYQFERWLQRRKTKN